MTLAVAPPDVALSVTFHDTGRFTFSLAVLYCYAHTALLRMFGILDMFMIPT